MARSLTFLLASFAAGAVLAGCDGGSGGSTTTTTGTTTDTATGGTGGDGGNGGAAGGGGSTAGGGQGGTGGAPAVCGDGLLAAGEGCDDGDTEVGDGCDADCAVEDGYTCAGEPSDCLTVCGDGVIAGSEICDDGNSDPGDGCDADCAVEDGYTCDGAPSACVTTCGDGILAGAETCDDTNADSQDGCSAECQIEVGYTCDGIPSICVTTCGDGILAGSEVCDDGNLDASDGCDEGCAPDAGYTCAGQPSVCNTVCGDGIVAGAEACDDTNLQGGDGCTAQCDIEDGFVCLSEPSACNTVCGDGIVAGAEACDDDGTSPGDGCSAMCQVESGYACTGAPSTCATVCGDGVLVLPESCDDGDGDGGDGCNASCQIEEGYLCFGLPSTCITVCGDGIIAGVEVCDDSGTDNGDGCTDGCTIEPGFYCSSEPSACLTQCGDGITAGDEQCDDGNTIYGDGCGTDCEPNSGETCAEPLLTLQAAQAGGQYVWTVPSSGVATADGDFACDPNGIGPDVIVKYTKTSDTLANGGQLLHVKADTPSSTSTSYYLNLEVKGGACEQGMGTSLKCDWYKDNWDSYLDVPPGDYWIYVAKNSAATASAPFPEVTILAEEVAPAAAEGEGCFAPYTTASANYTPPGGAGMPHTWLIADGAINSFDMSATWGEPGSISCDNTATYGDIHGVDAVIEYNKTSPTSVLKIDVQNLDPVISQSDLNLEVLSVCDSTNPSKLSRNCRANKDAISITAPSPAGDVYLWVTTEATSEELQGASVQVTEIFPGVGESWPTAEPITGSGPITATSTQRLDAPSCFPTAGNIHWYSYTIVNDTFWLSSNNSGYVGVYDTGGQEVRCVTSAQTTPINFLATSGETYYIAVQSPTPITSLTLQDVVYNGIGSTVTDMMVSFPSSATGEYSMAIDANQIVMADTVKAWAFPKTVGASAIEYGTAVGITSTHLGYDIEFAGPSLFGVDSTTTTTASRVYRLFDGAVWGPGTAWDIGTSYVSAVSTYALGTDGVTLFQALRKTSTDTPFYSVNPATPSTPVLLGTTPGIWYTVGMAADATYFYVAGNGSGGEGVYRVLRSNLAAAPVKIASIDTSTTHHSIDVDSHVAAQYLYVRDYPGDVHVIKDPGGANPFHVGPICTLGTTSDYSMAHDKAANVLYLFETETVSTGRVIRLQ